ncbi:MAG: peptide chain release factor N(5)-glutamine methyltransferase [Verrucomicrobiae bacterium]|nr:peptide chain release factor N(5)-glutamine methyltransferase [Verrucomicrobiae bacterium]
MTILELIQKTTAFFEKAGVPTPRLDVELLLAHILGLRRMDLYVQFERILTDSELDRLRPLVKRRAAREPLQHLVGTVEFCGVTLAADRRALIPRPETEILVERALALRPGEGAAAVFDVGTGGGAIVLALLAARPAWRAVAADLSREALALARENAASTALADRVEFREGDLLAPLREGERFDLVVSNPPYVPTATLAHLQPEVRDHDPKAALDGGTDGLDLIRRLATETPRALKPDGHLLLEIGSDQAEAVEALFEAAGWSGLAFTADLQGHRRIVEARRA